MAKRIDEYLIKASGKDNITSAIIAISEMLGVAVSTVHRWRRSDRIDSASHCLSIISAINANGEKLGTKAIAILCDWQGGYR